MTIIMFIIRSRLNVATRAAIVWYIMKGLSSGLSFGYWYSYKIIRTCFSSLNFYKQLLCMYIGIHYRLYKLFHTQMLIILHGIVHSF